MRKIGRCSLVVLFLTVFFLSVPLRVSAEENPVEFEFLECCDLEMLSEWDDELAVFTAEQKRTIKEYMDYYIIYGVNDDYKKAELIYEWIVNNITYDYNNAGADPYSVFYSGKAVCGGYSNLYKAMLHLADIPAVVLVGNSNAGAHAWNAVYAEGRWFYADSTWGKGWFDIGNENFNGVDNCYHSTTRVEGAELTTKEGMVLGYDQGIAVIGTDGKASELTIPDSYNGLEITSVSYRLFDDKYGVKKVTLGMKIDHIDTQISSKAIEAIEVSKDNQNYASVDGVLFSKDLKQMYIYPSAKKDDSFTLPKETESFDEKEAFSNIHLQNLNVEKNNIKYSSYDGLLYNAEQTELLMIPAGRTEIHILENAEISYAAFANVSNIEAVVIYAKKDSPAYKFAIDNKIRFVEITEEIPEEKKDVTKIFSDVLADFWYVDEVQYVFDKGIMTGTSDTTFEPTTKVSRAMIVQTLYKLEGKPEVTDLKKYEALKDHQDNIWWKNGLAWALNTGVAKGDSKTQKFNPDNAVTREDLATFIYRYAKNVKKLNVELTKTTDEILGDTPVNSWAKEAFAWAVETGLIKGKTVGNKSDLAPQAGATRAELATIMMRFYENNKL